MKEEMIDSLISNVTHKAKSQLIDLMEGNHKEIQQVAKQFSMKYSGVEGLESKIENMEEQEYEKFLFEVGCFAIASDMQKYCKGKYTYDEILSYANYNFSEEAVKTIYKADGQVTYGDAFLRDNSPSKTWYPNADLSMAYFAYLSGVKIDRKSLISLLSNEKKDESTPITFSAGDLVHNPQLMIKDYEGNREKI